MFSGVCLMVFAVAISSLLEAVAWLVELNSDFACCYTESKTVSSHVTLTHKNCC
jgi:hypothetical protein